MHWTTDLVLSRGVDTVLPDSKTLWQKMESGKVRIYLGIDPTGNQLHLGHAVVLRKLQQFVDLGHEVILLIGNGTVRIGDPTGKDKTRPMLSDEEIEKNFQTWKEQASKVLDFSKLTVRRNADWLDTLTYADLVKLMATTTVQQLLERDMFQDRLKNNLPIHAHELIYPLLQGYDSYFMDVDVELGGTDQIFNMLVGRQLQKSWRNKEKWVIGVPLLVGSDGRKMGKSLGNFIPLLDTPANMYGKLMSVADEVIWDYFRLLTDVPDAEIEAMQHAVSQGQNPMLAKKKLAHTITTWLHSAPDADEAATTFERVVQRKEEPENYVKVHLNTQSLAEVVAATTSESKSHASRLIEQGSVRLNGQEVRTLKQTLQPGDKLKIGKRIFIELE